MNSDVPDEPLRPDDGPAPAPDVAGQGAPDAPPEGLDYEVVRLIGRGGYGEVWLVRDRSGTYRACKVIYRVSFDNDRPYEREYAGIRRFEPVSRADECQVKILHVGRRDEAGYFYYIMELGDDANSGPDIDPLRYVPKTLRSELAKRGRLPVNECIHLGLSLSATLDHLHRSGLIHRDIKPANIIFVNGIPKLADIGLVTDRDRSVSYVGTEGYIPPEGPTSAQADIYGLGKVLYEISTGKDRLDFPELPEDLGEAADRSARLEFNAIVNKACQQQPGGRYRSAREMHAEIALLQSGVSIRKHRSFRKKLRWGSVAAGFVALGLLAWAAFVRPAKPVAPLLDATPAPPAPSTPRLPVPEAALTARNEQEIRQQFEARIAAGPHSQAGVARELLGQSATKSDPSGELACLRLAASLAADSEDFEVAMGACETMGDRFQIDPLAAKLELLSKAVAKRPDSKAGPSFMEACVGSGFAAIAVDDYEHAAVFAELSATAAGTMDDSHYKWEAGFLREELSRCRSGYEEAKGFADFLRANPADPRGNFGWGKFLCFLKNDWRTGLPMMARGGDDFLKEVLESELANRAYTPVAQVATGDLWWDLSGRGPGELEHGFQIRARYWYLKGIAHARRGEKIRLRGELAQRIKAIPAPVAEVRIFSRVETTEQIIISGDEVRWSSSRGSRDNRVNHVRVGDLKIGEIKVLRNCGPTRVVPETVDFSTAELSINHKGKRRGTASLEVAEDHVRVTLIDRPAGASELEVTVTFRPRSGE